MEGCGEVIGEQKGKKVAVAVMVVVGRSGSRGHGDGGGQSEDGRRRTSDGGTKDGQRSEGSVLLPSLQTHSRERHNLGTSREKLNKNKTEKRRWAGRPVGRLGRLKTTICLFENQNWL